MKKEECPKCDGLSFVFDISLPSLDEFGDVDIWECRECGHKAVLKIVPDGWFIHEGEMARITRALEVAANKYELGMIHTRKAPGEYPCCDALHEFETSLHKIDSPHL